MEPLMATITCFAGNFAPKGWAFCNGQLLAISQNQALFSILGTTYGGNGVTTFALPDLRGRTAVTFGQGPGLGSYNLGQAAGAETVTLTINNLPAHIHNGAITLNLKAGSAAGSDPTPDFNFPGKFTGAYAASATGTMQAPDYTGTTIGNAGNSNPANILSPYLVVNYIIALVGIFPSRN
ncbi:MAG: tail fiber protein [Chitinophagaceae bacterium]